MNSYQAAYLPFRLGNQACNLALHISERVSKSTLGIVLVVVLDVAFIFEDEEDDWTEGRTDSLEFPHMLSEFGSRAPRFPREPEKPSTSSIENGILAACL